MDEYVIPPTIGSVVLVCHRNLDHEHPAIITNVHPGYFVDVFVLTGVSEYGSHKGFLTDHAHVDLTLSMTPNTAGMYWRWPPRNQRSVKVSDLTDLQKINLGLMPAPEA